MKRKLFVLFFFILIFLNLVLSQVPDPTGQIPFGDKITDGEKAIENIENFKEGFLEEKEGNDREYLVDQYEEILLSNEMIAGVNSIFEDYSIVFRIFFGVPYEFSFTMFFIIVLWFCVFLGLPYLISSIDFFNRISSWIVSLLIVVILAQAQFFRVVVSITDKLLFASENGWVRFILGIVLLFIFIMVYYLEHSIGKYFEKLKRERKKKDLENRVSIPIDKLEGQKKGMEEDLG
jgi:ABC-type multidrug transport system fused ATPase/permease subunit